MPTLSPRKSALPADWSDVLDNIERTLAQTLAEATDRERALHFGASFPDPAAPTAPVQQGLDERLRGFAARLQQAEQEALALDADLQAAQEQIESWLRAAEGFRQKLAPGDAASLK